MRIVEATVESGHHSLARENNAPDCGVGSWVSAGKSAALEYWMQIGWNLLELKIVLFVAVGTAHFVEMFTFGLLRRKRLRRATGRERVYQAGGQKKH